jgi:hypothetical protein
LSATEGDEVFSVALWTTNAGEASFGAAAGKELLHRPHHDGAQWSVLGLEALFVSPNIAVEVVLKQLVQGSFFRMARPIRSRRIAHQKARLRRKGIVQLPREFFE